MSKLWLIGLAASTAWTTAAAAQPAPPAPPPMAHGAHAPMPPPGAPLVQMHRVAPPGAPHRMVMHRIGRGHMLPPMFMGPQFVVHDWRLFGFPAPMPGGRWVRYYDDALLVGPDGRVMDGRYGWDWDGRGGGHGDDDYDDMAYEDEEDGRHRRSMHGEEVDRVDVLVRRDGHHGDMRGHGGDGRVMKFKMRRDGCRRSCPPVRHVPPPPPVHPGYGYGYGYGCGCGPIVVTETTTTTAPVVEYRTYYETVTHRAAPRRHRARPVVRHAKPVRRPVSVKARPGERG